MLPVQTAGGHGSQGGQVRQPSLFPAAITYEADPCTRHRGAATSIDAHERILPHKTAAHARILALARASGADGITVHEVAAELGTTPNGVSGRLTELKAAQHLRPRIGNDGRPVRRRGAAVLVAVERPPGLP